ncbi:MAG TPA: aminomethyl-transferring glycine dehydrogenase subunit GcvPA [Blastocatellia bacterium]|nr:aminomethyl-transferring glycine dehydrogenase subunit GcvPA [Blastocatellia bacterium]HMV81677.1 aminomethyl-transferring glycine dehydrogenase subunit GcvPA [Blastocatellia bacterium]HMX30104.1 aminomethyl-transferring glycine dehydrogenase subunit GcvPA [Blastocatellia bacterium]HNG29635.1 aminomethyl-transferring glycine dehydrogenase subunit GcvPA [Blastocatellia bacterium]
MRYIPNSAQEREAMLREMGRESISDLFKGIPDNLQLKRLLDLPAALSETDTLNYFRSLAERNTTRLTGERMTSFLGAGAYDHFIPTIIDTLISRSEFYTSYTPYQPEISQGTLQAIFEYQTMICELTGMDVSNASLYDGSTAAAEAVLMAERVTGRTKVALAGNLHPEYRQVVDTYIRNAGIEEITLPFDEATGALKVEAMSELGNDVGAVIVQSPNFFGGVEELQKLADAAHKVGALFVVVVAEALSLGLLQAPGKAGADIVCGEAQSFGIPISFGGSYCGFFACREKLQRQIPGRLVGQALDHDGRLGYVLTLATREQHIRREKATSNICTNQGLYALMATVYLSTMGRQGVREVAEQNVQKAHYAAKQIGTLNGYQLRFGSPFFNEFVVSCTKPAGEVLTALQSKHIIGGLALERFFPEMKNEILICVTEQTTKAQIDALVEALKTI